MLGRHYKNYKNALNLLELESLEDRRIQLCTTFAKYCLKNSKTKNLFPKNKNIHPMKLRKTETFHVTQAITERLKKSSIPQMQMILNEAFHKE